MFILFSQVNKAVIAVPAKFSQLQRQATAEVIDGGITHGVLSMDAFVFGAMH